MSLTIQQWLNSGLIPTSGLQAWHKYKNGDSTNNTCLDYSGNNRTLAQATNPPALSNANSMSAPGWYFDGTKNPLDYVGSTIVKNVFVLASADEAAFGTTRGLWSSPLVVDYLVGEYSMAHFQYLGNPSFSYFKNNVEFDDSDMQAPMDGAFALVEFQTPLTGDINGIRIGRVGDTAATTFSWKGWFIEQFVYNRVLTEAEKNRLLLYFNLEFRAFSKFGLPLYFPSDDIVPIRRRRFYAEPPQMSKITDSFEFEDGGRTFNESGDTAPRRWEYDYKLINNSEPTDPPAVKIFDEFYEAVRLSQAFNFTDKYGTVWDNVRIESYDRDHEAHKPWVQTVRFKLIRYPN